MNMKELIKMTVSEIIIHLFTYIEISDTLVETAVHSLLFYLGSVFKGLICFVVVVWTTSKYTRSCFNLSTLFEVYFFSFDCVVSRDIVLI